MKGSSLLHVKSVYIIESYAAFDMTEKEWKHNKLDIYWNIYVAGQVYMHTQVQQTMGDTP